MQETLDEFVKVLWTYWIGFLYNLPKIIAALLILTVAYFLAGKLKKIVCKRLEKKSHDPLLATFIGRMVKILIMIGAFVVAMQAAGLGNIAAGIIAGAGASALIIGFAFKDIGENFISGVILAFNRPFKIGDEIQTSGFRGTIERLDLRVTYLKANDGNDVFIPNSTLLKNPLINHNVSLIDKKSFTVSISYKDDVKQAIDLITEVISGFDKIEKPKSQSAVLSEFMDTGIKLSVFYWVDLSKIKGSELSAAESNIKIAIKDKLIENGFDLERGDVNDIISKKGLDEKKNKDTEGASKLAKAEALDNKNKAKSEEKTSEPVKNEHKKDKEDK